MKKKSKPREEFVNDLLLIILAGSLLSLMFNTWIYFLIGILIVALIWFVEVYLLKDEE